MNAEKVISVYSENLERGEGVYDTAQFSVMSSFPSSLNSAPITGV